METSVYQRANTGINNNGKSPQPVAGPNYPLPLVQVTVQGAARIMEISQANGAVVLDHDALCTNTPMHIAIGMDKRQRRKHLLLREGGLQRRV